MNILLTGGTGFVGSSLVPYLCEKGHNLTLLSRGEGKAGNKRITFIKGDLLNAELDLVKDIRFCEMAILLAGIAENSNNKTSYWLTNVDALERLLRQLKETNIKKIIYISSNKVLDKNVSAYGLSKKEAEKLIEKYCLDMNVQFCILRPGVIYGKGMKNRINRWIDRISSGKMPSLPESNATLSMISIHDFCRAITCCMENSEAWNRKFLLTDENEYRINELEQKIRNILNQEKSITIPKGILYSIAIVGEIVTRLVPGKQMFNLESFEVLFKREAEISREFSETTGFNAGDNFYRLLPEIVTC